ncbi:hypothetical protein L596_029995 [Steinernema carpocapsae]|uniref:Uncharacterized protein n=1 Tax=Steinernema carpocapsae TaxID=34508 RepID=A0A4U5LRE9_STECR|nr:hypothetical protein L596_029995 [Steinernema carpocapsae]
MRFKVQEEELELQKQELSHKENDIRALEKRLEEEQQISLAAAPLAQAPEFASKGCSLFAEVDDGRRRQEEDMRKLAEKNALLIQMMRKAQEEVRRTQEELQNMRNLGTGTSYDSDFVNQICVELNERKATISRQIDTIMLLERQVKAKTVVPPSATVLRSENEELTERCRMIQMEKAKLFDENRKLDRINGTQKNALRKLEFELKMAQDRLGQALKSRENVNRAKGSPIVEHILNASEVISFAREMPTTSYSGR